MLNRIERSFLLSYFTGLEGSSFIENKAVDHWKHAVWVSFSECFAVKLQGSAVLRHSPAFRIL